MTNDTVIYRGDAGFPYGGTYDARLSALPRVTDGGA
jgi:hypothetical protein